MKLSILTMVTRPDERQDLWHEALSNYCDLADEVVVVNGGPELTYNNPKVKFVNLIWHDAWDWQTLPEHLNFGLSHCSGEWVLKLDIDQLIHEKEMPKIRKIIETVPPHVELLSLMKLNFVANMRYFAKNTQPILFRRKPDIGFGYAYDFPKGDCCMPIRLDGTTFKGMPAGETMPSENTDCAYWNFSYTFKTKEIARDHYLRMCRAWRKYYETDALGANDEQSWEQFMDMTSSKYIKAKEVATFYDIPGSLREAIKNIRPEQKGFDFWGEIKHITA